MNKYFFKYVNFVTYDIISYFDILFETWYKGFLDFLMLFKQVKHIYGFYFLSFKKSYVCKFCLLIYL